MAVCVYDTAYDDKVLFRELTILLYHGVTNCKSNGIENDSGKHLSLDVFCSQMASVKKYCTVLSIDDIIEIYQSGTSYPPYSVVISFDDGFRNNFTHAAPILDEMSIPAVFYIASGMIGTERMFWVDRIEDCINLTQVDHLEIGLGTEKKMMHLGNDDAKIQAVNLIKRFCKNVTLSQRDDVLHELQVKTKVEPSVEHSENYQVMNWSEVIALNNHSLFTIGGHSAYHDILSLLPENQMLADIDLSLELLKRYLNCQIYHYSYPEGQKQHYNNHVISVLKDRGIRCCPSAIHGTNPQKMDLFHLRRIMVGFQGVSFPFIQHE